MVASFVHGRIVYSHNNLASPFSDGGYCYFFTGVVLGSKPVWLHWSLAWPAHRTTVHRTRWALHDQVFVSRLVPSHNLHQRLFSTYLQTGFDKFSVGGIYVFNFATPPTNAFMLQLWHRSREINCISNILATCVIAKHCFRISLTLTHNSIAFQLGFYEYNITGSYAG